MCPVCFTGSDPEMRETLNAGIGVLMGVTALVLALFARFFVKLARRSRAAAHLVDHRLTSEPQTSGQHPSQADLKVGLYPPTSEQQHDGSGRPSGRPDEPTAEQQAERDGRGRPSGRPDERRIA